MVQLKALAFDAFGTLFDVHAIDELCASFFPDVGVALSRRWRQKQLEYTWLRSLMGQYVSFEQVTDEALRYAAASFGLVLTPTVHNHLLQAYQTLRSFPEVPSVLQKLARRYALVVLSNGTAAQLQTLLQRSNLESYFAAVLSAEQVQVFKPHPRVYALAEAALQLPRGEIGFVSANGWDVAGAAAYGYWTFWVNRYGRPDETLGFSAAAVGQSLVDLEQALQT
ncbi:haloacid dehalogenase type II [Rhodothermus profundi]|uniref:2-haloacid dehalogenase n=1 Tax=Rhodothermus profundi TaxID=633813 RepID=A0A1M6TI32_9BACT|nr:haloacid dehalogenase type II [Rhodothermus profundi]SHK56438.1 2-haloacid dehalogenase [Rhodothermus profundi]